MTFSTERGTLAEAMVKMPHHPWHIALLNDGTRCPEREVNICAGPLRVLSCRLARKPLSELHAGSHKQKAFAVYWLLSTYVPYLIHNVSVAAH